MVLTFVIRKNDEFASAFVRHIRNDSFGLGAAAVAPQAEVEGRSAYEMGTNRNVIIGLRKLLGELFSSYLQNSRPEIHQHEMCHNARYCSVK